MTGSRTVAENRQKGSKTSCSGKKLRSAHAHTHTHTHTHTHRVMGLCQRGTKQLKNSGQSWSNLGIIEKASDD